MLALWMYQWDETEWVAAPPAPAPAPVEAPRSNAGGGKRRNDYIGPSPDFWEVRERYLRRYEKAISEASVIAKNNFPSQEPHDNLSGDRAGGIPSADTANDLQAVLELMRFELEVARARARQARNATELQEAMRAAMTLALDIRKIEQQYYDRAISILLLNVF